MMTAIRTSKRLAVGGIIGFCLVLLCLLAVKDMNDKLGVMTASNSGYQKMTDSQASKIKRLTSELEGVRLAKVSELNEATEREKQLKAKIRRLEAELSSSNDNLDTCQKKQQELSYEWDQSKQLAARLEKDAEKMAQQLAQAGQDRDACKRQYAALFKLHQETSDAVQALKQDKQRLQLELTDATSESPVKPIQTAAKSSSSPAPIGRLEEPNVNKQLSSSSTAGSNGNKPMNAPPVGFDEKKPARPFPVHVDHVAKEDVMEAPKVAKDDASRAAAKPGQNLDTQIDPVHHDHPGLDIPVFRDVHHDGGEEDENDAEDPVDGQLDHVYHDEGQVEEDNLHFEQQQHHNDINYDFDDAFRQGRLGRQHVGPRPPQNDKIFLQQPLMMQPKLSNKVKKNIGYLPHKPVGYPPYARLRTL